MKNEKKNIPDFFLRQQQAMNESLTALKAEDEAFFSNTSLKISANKLPRRNTKLAL
ncbi:MAG: hypothetical protein R8N23_05425 [Reichenbachiella sp.]|uniref:hypothetical protein n=1 Tax=Reichenbachiella sp. TaxID=2184521 RepID=UPI002966EF9F|nr:hypothetical protein [Reichenbachiella sp.]MDW3209284.1 hypothetical protein [Reichenbachiella sp.]